MPSGIALQPPHEQVWGSGTVAGSLPRGRVALSPATQGGLLADRGRRWGQGPSWSSAHRREFVSRASAEAAGQGLPLTSPGMGGWTSEVLGTSSSSALCICTGTKAVGSP